MKNRHLSAFMLAAGNVVYKALAVALAAAAVQLALLFWQAGSASGFQEIFDGWPDGPTISARPCSMPCSGAAACRRAA